MEHYSEKKNSLTVLSEITEPRILACVPLVLTNTALLCDRQQDKLFARCTFRVITGRAVRAVRIQILCKDVWGNVIGEPIAYQYMDLKTKPGSVFGQNDPIELPERTIRNLQITVQKVLLDNDTVLNGSDGFTSLPEPVPLEQHLQSKELAAQYVRLTTPKARFVPFMAQEAWRCACGAINGTEQKICADCRASAEQLTAALKPETLDASLAQWLEEERLAAENRQAQERIRREEEAARERQRKEEQWQKYRQEQAQQTRKKLKIFKVLTLVLTLALAFAAVVWGYSRIMPDSHKCMWAQVLMQCGQYQKAHELLTEADGYEGSHELLTEVIVQWGEQLWVSDPNMENVYLQAVGLTEDQYDDFYEMLLRQLRKSHIEYWYDGSPQAGTRLMQKMLLKLPNSYQNVADLATLFTLFGTYGNYRAIFQDNAQLIKNFWEFQFIREMAESDEAISYFLIGDWRGKGYYFQCDEDLSCSYSLPEVSKPYGTAYYDIEDLVYYYEDEDDNHLATVFRFEIVDYNCIKVYCYKDASTYTLRR